MSEIFSGEWMLAFQKGWNEDQQLADELERVGFSSVIAYGFDDEEDPRVVVVVEKGRVASAGPYHGQSLNWDLRAGKAQWEAWRQKVPSLMALGLAYTQRKLRFKVGDYATMVKDPRLAGPFVRSFSVMARI